MAKKDLNKREIVREALRRLGNDAKLVPIQQFAKQEYGQDLSTDLM